MDEGDKDDSNTGGRAGYGRVADGGKVIIRGVEYVLRKTAENAEGGSAYRGEKKPPEEKTGK